MKVKKGENEAHASQAESERPKCSFCGKMLVQELSKEVKISTIWSMNQANNADPIAFATMVPEHVTLSNDNKKWLKLENVLYVPSASKNLLSIPRVNKMGKLQMALTNLMNGLYWLNSTQLQEWM